MNRLHILGIILGSSTAGFLASFYLLALNYQTSSAEQTMSDMMRRMMGMQSPMTQPVVVQTPFYLWVLPPVFMALLIFGLIGLVYFLVVPEIKLSKIVTPVAGARPPDTALTNEKFSTVLKTLRSDEAKVLNVLISQGGKYLQKHISRETELSRLKTHRIIARLAARGIVTVRSSGNTNEVSISEWLKSEGLQEKSAKSP